MQQELVVSLPDKIKTFVTEEKR